MEGIVLATIEYVKKEMEGNDASHDWPHCERVWKLAKHIYEKEKDTLNVSDPLLIGNHIMP